MEKLAKSYIKRDRHDRFFKITLIKKDVYCKLGEVNDAILYYLHFYKYMWYACSIFKAKLSGKIMFVPSSSLTLIQVAGDVYNLRKFELV
jgi:hypothetical protein